MTADGIYKVYLHWLDGAEPCAQSGMFRFLVADEDVLEDKHQVISRHFYLIPSLGGSGPRCFAFYEETVFRKDAQGELNCIHSAYYPG